MCSSDQILISGSIGWKIEAIFECIPSIVFLLLFFHLICITCGYSMTFPTIVPKATLKMLAICIELHLDSIPIDVQSWNPCSAHCFFSTFTLSSVFLFRRSIPSSPPRFPVKSLKFVQPLVVSPPLQKPYLLLSNGLSSVSLTLSPFALLDPLTSEKRKVLFQKIDKAFTEADENVRYPQIPLASHASQCLTSILLRFTFFFPLSHN